MSKTEFKVDDCIVGSDSMGDRIGYFMEIEVERRTGKEWVRYGSKKSTDPRKGNAVYVRALESVRLATKEEIEEYER